MTLEAKISASWKGKSWRGRWWWWWGGGRNGQVMMVETGGWLLKGLCFVKKEGKEEVTVGLESMMTTGCIYPCLFLCYVMDRVYVMFFFFALFIYIFTSIIHELIMVSTYVSSFLFIRLTYTNLSVSHRIYRFHTKINIQNNVHFCLKNEPWSTWIKKFKYINYLSWVIVRW